MKRVGSSQVGPNKDRIQSEIKPDISEMRYYEQRLHLRRMQEEGGFGDKELNYPSWLVDGTNFASNVWQCCFGADKNIVRMTVDFNVKLHDGSLLTDLGNAALLKGFKVFLVVQIHPKYNGGKRRQGETESNIFRCALKFIDHLLMNGKRLNLPRLRLNLLRKIDLSDYLITKTGYPTSTCLYDYPSKLALFLRKVSVTITDTDVKFLTERFPYIIDLPPVWDRSLDLTDDELVKARAYIVDNKLYIHALGVLKYNSSPFLGALYGNTLSGANLTPPTFDELNEGVAWNTEFPAVPVRNESTPTVTKRMLSRHFRVVQRLRLVQELVPEIFFNSDACVGIKFQSIYNRVEKKVAGRYRDLPGEVVFDLVRDSYGYIYNNSHTILQTVATFAWSNRKNNRYSQANHDSYSNDELSAGIKGYGRGFDSWLIPLSARNDDYYTWFRSGKSLFSSFVTLMGCYLAIIGALTARRQAELLGLMENNCLYPNKDPNLPESSALQYELGFMAGKTGNRHAKEYLTVPIPRLVAKLLWDLKFLHRECVRLDLIPVEYPLFLYIRPDNLTFRPMCATSYNSCLSAICDFTQTPTVTLENGEVSRFYVRQHQLRRFFAMAFFSGAGFNELDALRAFLGHSDIQHLYTYIVSITPGAMLQGVKAQSLTKAILYGESNIENLNSLKQILCETHDLHDLSAKSLPELRSIIQRSSTRTDSPDEAKLTQLTETAIYSDLDLLLSYRLIDLQPTYARVMNDAGNFYDVHLVVKVNN
jgi:hypothetical protein